ncbi:hypothetical protein acdb102_05080 [Acidothermaceae bacterium B102]|nr:hypothetical protein acdb102_05080 [Acidothermaceae bacterium B102]
MPDTSAALDEARSSFDWYERNAKASRLRYQISEVVLVCVAAAVPIAGILAPSDARLPAVLGAVVVALTGLRAIFHWRDNWMRFSLAGSAIKAEIRLYGLHADPYSDLASRDAVLIRNINSVEHSETSGWMSLAGPDSSAKS